MALKRLLGACLLAIAGPASAVVLGQVDDFQGSDEGWFAGLLHPAPPAVQPGGWLLATALGGLGAGSKLGVIGGPQWAGNYTAASVTGLRMDLNNLGDTELSLRVLLEGGLSGNALSAQAFVLPAHSGWVSHTFGLAPQALVGQNGAVPGVVLGATQQIRLFHNPDAFYAGPAVVASLGLDNVAAVPEPAAPLLAAAGALLVLCATRRGRIDA